MTFYRPLIVLAAASVIFVSPSFAARADCNCFSIDDQYADRTSVYAIDSRNGKRVKGNDEYAKGADVSIILDDQNPYLYNYALTHKAEDVESATILEALKALGIHKEAEEAKADTEEKAKEAATAATPMPLGGTCTAVIERDAAAAEVIEGNRLSGLIMAQTGTSGGGLFSPTANCQQLCAASHSVQDQKQDLKNALEAVTARKTKINSNWASWLATPACSALAPSLQLEKPFIDGVLSASIEQLTKYESVVDEVEKQLASATPFHTEKRPGTNRTPKRHTVTVERNSVEGAKASKDIWTHTYQTGYNRFSYSLGIGIGFIEQEEFDAGTTNVGETGETPGQVVRVSETTNEQIGIVGQLNGELYRWDNLSWLNGEGISVLWSVGASITNGTDDVNFGFYTGPTLGFVDNQLLMTFGYHVLRVDEPDTGFEEGATLPPDFSGDVPTSSKTDSGLLLSFTWRFQ